MMSMASDRRHGNNAASDPVPGVNRTTSISSVLTLPAYTAAARPTERIVGREGERGGVDVVLEYPETAEEEEARREEEMASLYNIRTARRAERQAREDERQSRLRQDRDEDLANGQDEDPARNQANRLPAGNSMLDVPSTLTTSNRSSIGTGNEISSDALLANHQAAMLNNSRRTSSVAYDSVGVAFHNGTRVRASSDAGSAIAADNDTDGRSAADVPLLSSAASMDGTGVSTPVAGSVAGLGPASPTTLSPLPTHSNACARSTSEGSNSNSNSNSAIDASSANGAAAAATILTPPVSSDESIPDGAGVATPLDDDMVNPPPGYDAQPPTYDDAETAAQRNAASSR